MKQTNRDRTQPPGQERGHHQLIVIAASIGGIGAIDIILSALPRTFPVPLAIVQHRGSDPSSQLAEILGRGTKMKVKDARAGEAVRPGTAYLAPGGRHLAVLPDRTFALSDGPRVQFARPAADVLFASAAEVYGEDAIAIVLTGADGDGSQGAVEIRKAGGIVIAQDAASSVAFSMPASAIAKGAVTQVLPLREIGPRLLQLTGHG